MSIILAIETSTQQCSVALFKNGAYYSESIIEERSHSRVLLPMIASLIDSANCHVSELSALAVTHGPGTFTGLRIGLGVIKGLALGQNLPIYSVSSLAIMAYGLLEKHSDKAYFMPLLDARMGELYAGYYHYDNTHLLPVKADELISIDSDLVVEDFVLGGTGSLLLDSKAMLEKGAIMSDLHYPDAKFLLDYVLKYQSELTAETASSLSPVYLRNKVV